MERIVGLHDGELFEASFWNPGVLLFLFWVIKMLDARHFLNDLDIFDGDHFDFGLGRVRDAL